MNAEANAVTPATRRWIDDLGVWTSALCVVHCLLTPLLLSLSPVLAHFLPGEESVHRMLARLVALFGAVALFAGFRKHRRRLILLLMLGGVGCIAGGAWFGDALPSHAAEVIVTFSGSALMIAAHRLNHTFCRACDCSRGARPGCSAEQL